MDSRVHGNDSVFLSLMRTNLVNQARHAERVSGLADCADATVFAGKNWSQGRAGLTPPLHDPNRAK
jgi:hypothetical protein